jgi:hypothetical protein
MIEQWWRLEEKEGDLAAGIRNTARICAVIWLAIALVVSLSVWVMMS